MTIDAQQLPYFGFPLTVAALFAIIALRYFLVAGLAHWWFYYRRAPRLARKVYPEFPGAEQIRREIAYSLVSCGIFAVVGAAGIALWRAGYGVFYDDFSHHTPAYAAFSLVAMMALHETYFYFSHRLLHHPWLFRRVHKVHHDSRNPTPWASFCFHPWETLVQAMALPLLVAVIPVHPVIFLVYLTVMTVSAVINHLGYEIFPRGFATHPVGKWCVGATHHALHHRNLRYNFGLYFTLWDRLLSTECPEYPAHYRRITEPDPPPTLRRISA